MMLPIKLNGNVMKRCAFCKYWYDPANQHIQPQDLDIHTGNMT